MQGALNSGAIACSRPRTPARRREDLHVCPACASQLVQPTDWAQSGRERWRVSLLCPDCEWTGGGVFGQDVVDRFDESLDAAMRSVLDDLQLLTKANMHESVERFTEALQAGLILPEDF